MEFIKQTINILADIFTVLIFVRVIFSWLNVRQGYVARLVKESTDPILLPIQRSLPRTGMLDLSPLVAYFLIEIIRSILNQML